MNAARHYPKLAHRARHRAEFLRAEKARPDGSAAGIRAGAKRIQEQVDADMAAHVRHAEGLSILDQTPHADRPRDADYAAFAWLTVAAVGIAFGA